MSEMLKGKMRIEVPFLPPVGQVGVVVDPDRAPLTIIELDEIKKLEEGSET
ncbi:unnamed protein product [marine sediment metagenome]|uniref:Uncharacterized protein n=1 Tax=marine sediment metagenome TaxID=412755 RepID=X1UBH5_9ZZZZ